MTRPPRGIRNNNPGNIRRGAKWNGRASLDEMTPAQKAETAFAVFKAPEWGIRAIARVLLTYQRKHRIRTVRGIIGRWAPPNENDTGSYVLVVARQLGVLPGQAVDVENAETMRVLVTAIIRHENGLQPYSAEQIDDGLKLAGIAVPEPEESAAPADPDPPPPPAPPQPEPQARTRGPFSWLKFWR